MDTDSLSVYGKSIVDEPHGSMIACQVYDILKGLCTLCSNVDYGA
jgi:hypothetical protein